MNTKSSTAKLGTQTRYVPGSSRGPRSVTTLLAQVDDIERGQRIKALRESLHLTQPAVVELVEQAAWALPAGHQLRPDVAGKPPATKPPVTLRGYQTWEQGGGIAWEKAKLLAKVLQTDVRAMMNGVGDETPDLSRGAGEESQLDRIERELGEIRQQREGFLNLLAEQTKLLELIGELVGGDALATRADEAVKASIERTRGDLAKLLARASGQAVPGRSAAD